jgi:hypothetical protein
MSSVSNGAISGAVGSQAEFLHLARSPEQWMNSAEKLKKSADLIVAEMTRFFEQDRVTRALTDAWFQHRQGPRPPYCLEDWSLNLRIGDVFFLLAGLCIENLLKGMIVHAHPGYVKADGELGYSLKEHNLERLAKAAGVDGDMSVSERAILENGSEAVVAWGRYHIPKNHKTFQRQHGWDDEQFAAFNTLYRRWAERLIRSFAVNTYGTCFPGDSHESRMTPDEHVRWRLDRKRPGEA